MCWPSEGDFRFLTAVRNDSGAFGMIVGVRKTCGVFRNDSWGHRMTEEGLGMTVSGGLGITGGGGAFLFMGAPVDTMNLPQEDI